MSVGRRSVKDILYLGPIHHVAGFEDHAMHHIRIRPVLSWRCLILVFVTTPVPYEMVPKFMRQERPCEPGPFKGDG